MRLSKDKIREIISVIRRACLDAGVDYDTITPGVVPLFEIMGAFPLRVAELPDRKPLTAQSAIKFLGRETGQDLPAPSNGDRPLSGFIYVFEYEGFLNGCILTDANDPVTRRRFSAAHELAHYLLHFLPYLEEWRREATSEALILTEGVTFDSGGEAEGEPAAEMSAIQGVDSFQRLTLKTTPEMEREANRFAAELLMPAHACEAKAQQYVKRFGTDRKVIARKLATDFFVSSEAMKWRLKELDLYTSEE